MSVSQRNLTGLLNGLRMETANDRAFARVLARPALPDVRLRDHPGKTVHRKENPCGTNFVELSAKLLRILGA